MSTVLERRVQGHLTESRPVPMEMTDTEILDWMNEYFDELVYLPATETRSGGFTLHCYGIRTHAPDLRAVVRLAAAKWKEANE